MLSFMTEFPIDSTHSAAGFLRAIEKWILGSPHTCLRKGDLAEALAESEARKQKSGEIIEVLRVPLGSEERAGVRYTKGGNGLQWCTSIVFSRAAQNSWVAIRVLCEASHPATRLPPAKKPVLIRVLLNDLGGALDGPLRVGDSCSRLNNVDIDVAARLIQGRAGCHLPVVYVSAGFNSQYIVEPEQLARELAGMAHVVVEPNRAFSLRLRTEVDSENVYGGTVGIYWPDGGGRRSFFLGREFESPAQVGQAILAEVQLALTNRRGLDSCTWASLQEAASRQALLALRASGSQEVNKYAESFDRELAAKTELHEAAEKEIARLRNEIRIYEARLAANTGGLLRPGREHDLYPGETLAILRDALEDAKTRVPNDSRRQHVLSAVLEANPKEEEYAVEMRDRLKSLLRGLRGLDAKSKRELEEMGFSISEKGKHYKLLFLGDERYTFTLPKSGSDSRGGLNATSDIGKRLF